MDRDDLFQEAATIVVENQHASSAFLQMKLRIGYQRASKIIYQLEEAGIIGEFQGVKPRKILVKNIIDLRS